MLFAIDHGNYAIKTPHLSFPAGLQEYAVRPPLTTDCISFNGKYWALVGQRIPTMRDKTRDDRYFILTLFAIAKEVFSHGGNPSYIDADLAVGLPPEHYSVLREKFSSYFHRGVIHYTYNDTPICLSVRKTFVYPQAYAAVVPQSRFILDTPRIFLIDVGGYTVDVLLLRNSKPDLQFCRSLEMGTITMINSVIGLVGAQHDMRIEDDHVLSALCGEETILPEDVVKTIHEVARQHANGILDKLRELQVDLRANPAIFIGGGALLFKRFLEESSLISRPTFIADPKANAIGYELLAQAQLKQAAKQSVDTLCATAGSMK